MSAEEEMGKGATIAMTENPIARNTTTSSALPPDDKPQPVIIELDPGWTLFVFDVLFFTYYALGWILTWLFNPDAIDDNVVTRAYTSKSGEAGGLTLGSGGGGGAGSVLTR